MEKLFYMLLIERKFKGLSQIKTFARYEIDMLYIHTHTYILGVHLNVCLKTTIYL